MFETLQEIDQLQLNFSEDNKLLLNLTIGFIMFGVALELNLKDFRKLKKHPRPAILGIISQFILLPMLTFIIVWLLKDWITPTVGLGMILIAACPGGNVSNFISNLAKGNIALSVSLTAFATLAALILTPINFSLWGNLFMDSYGIIDQSFAIPKLKIDPIEVFRTILFILGIPLLAGLFVQYRFKRWTARFIVYIKRLSILAFSAIVVIIFFKNYDLFLEYIGYIFLLVLLHNALAFFTGYQVGRIGKLDSRDRKTLAIETGIQNSGLALALLFNPTLFPPELAIGGMTFIAAWWGVWHIVAGLSIAGIWSKFKW